ncbi:MAG: sugar phosphate isomerase/epimerase [Firmicutes bacterium]|nr:sugar phosphate isomerase/epimerase [Bacillota bacterium]
MKKPIFEMGASTCGNTILSKELFDCFANVGINHMEISVKYDYYDEINWSNIKKYSMDSGVELSSLHLPFHHDFNNPAHLEKDVRGRTLEKDTKLMQAAAEIGIGVAVIHASGEPIKNEHRPESMKHCKESLAILNERANRLGIVLAVENLPRTCLGNTSKELQEIISEIPDLRVCFDVNHLLCETHKSFVENIGSKIITTHISDYDFVDEKHWLPGRGKINWDDLIDLLASINYGGPFMYEVVINYDEVEPLLIYKKLKENYKMLFS